MTAAILQIAQFDQAHKETCPETTCQLTHRTATLNMVAVRPIVPFSWQVRVQ